MRRAGLALLVGLSMVVPAGRSRTRCGYRQLPAGKPSPILRCVRGCRRSSSVPRRKRRRQPAEPPKPPFVLSPEQQAEVDHALDLWEERNREIKTFDCRFKRWVYDAVFGRPDEAKFVELGVLR